MQNASQPVAHSLAHSLALGSISATEDGVAGSMAAGLVPEFSSVNRAVCFLCRFPLERDRSVLGAISRFQDMLRTLGYSIGELSLRNEFEGRISLKLNLVVEDELEHNGLGSKRNADELYGENARKRQAVAACRICASACSISDCDARDCNHRAVDCSPEQPDVHTTRAEANRGQSSLPARRQEYMDGAAPIEQLPVNSHRPVGNQANQMDRTEVYQARTGASVEQFTHISIPRGHPHSAQASVSNPVSHRVPQQSTIQVQDQFHERDEADRQHHLHHRHHHHHHHRTSSPVNVENAAPENAADQGSNVLTNAVTKDAQPKEAASQGKPALSMSESRVDPKASATNQTDTRLQPQYAAADTGSGGIKSSNGFARDDDREPNLSSHKSSADLGQQLDNIPRMSAEATSPIDAQKVSQPVSSAGVNWVQTSTHEQLTGRPLAGYRSETLLKDIAVDSCLPRGPASLSASDVQRREAVQVSHGHFELHGLNRNEVDTEGSRSLPTSSNEPRNSRLPYSERNDGQAVALAKNAQSGRNDAHDTNSSQELEHRRNIEASEIVLQPSTGRITPTVTSSTPDVSSYQMVMNTGDGIVVCEPCNTAFSTELERQRHIYKKHPIAPMRTANGRIMCSFSCGQDFSREQVMRRHLQSVHLNMREYPCQSCDKSFGDQSTLTQHTTAVHLKQKPWVCSICKSTFTQSSSLGKHRRRRHPETTAHSSSSVGMRSVSRAASSDDGDTGQSQRAARDSRANAAAVSDTEADSDRVVGDTSVWIRDDSGSLPAAHDESSIAQHTVTEPCGNNAEPNAFKDTIKPTAAITSRKPD